MMAFNSAHSIQNGTLRQAQLKMLNMLKFVDSICQKHGLDYWLEGGTLLGAVRHQGFIYWDDDLDICMPRESFIAFQKLAAPELPKHMSLQTSKTDSGYFNYSVPLKIRDNNSRYIAKNETGLEPYHQGIYMDIFPFDKRPNSKIQQIVYKFITKKLLRTLFHKYSPLYLYKGHYGKFYRTISKFITTQSLEKMLQGIITRANRTEDPVYLGYGYDCINNRCHRYSDIYPLQRIAFEDGHFNAPRNTDPILRKQFGDYWKVAPKHKRGMKHCRELIPHIDDVETYDYVNSPFENKMEQLEVHD